MGTRARVNVLDGNDILVSIYRQFDGYPSGLGQEVADFVSSLTLVNGMSGDKKGLANGIDCLAAQLIAHLKKEPGNVYIRNTREESHGEEFIYNVYERDGEIYLRAGSGKMTAFGAPGDTESEMTTIYDGPAKGFNGTKIENREEETDELVT